MSDALKKKLPWTWPQQTYFSEVGIWLRKASNVWRNGAATSDTMLWTPPSLSSTPHVIPIPPGTRHCNVLFLAQAAGSPVGGGQAALRTWRVSTESAKNVPEDTRKPPRLHGETYQLYLNVYIHACVEEAMMQRKVSCIILSIWGSGAAVAKRDQPFTSAQRIQHGLSRSLERVAQVDGGPQPALHNTDLLGWKGSRASNIFHESGKVWMGHWSLNTQQVP